MQPARIRKAIRRMQQDVLAGGERARRSGGWLPYFAVPLHPHGYRMAPDRRMLIPLKPYKPRAVLVPQPFDPDNYTLDNGRYYSDPSNIPGGGGEGGDYQESVYGGPPSLFWEPDKSTNGDGSSGDPYQYSQLASNVSAGDVVGLKPGFEEFANTSSDDTPVFDPGVDGTALARIVYVAFKDPGTMVNPLTDNDRTEIGHDGTGTTPSTTCPSMGWNNRDYVTIDSVVLNADNGPFVMDGGAVCAIDAVEPRMYRMWVSAVELAAGTLSNYIAIWNTTTTNLHVADCTFKNFRYTGQTTTNISAITLYSALGYLIENCHFENCNQAVYIKGNTQGGDSYNYGTIRRSRVLDCRAILRGQEMHATEFNDVYQVLATGIEAYGFTINQINAGTGRNLRVHNCTMVMEDASVFDMFGTLGGDIPLSGISYFENIAVMGASGDNFRFLPTDPGIVRMRDNLDYRASGTYQYVTQAANDHSGIAAFQTALTGIMSANAREENSVNANPLLDGDFRPGVGSPALTMGTASGLGGAGGEIGAYGGNPTIGRRVPD